MKVKFSTCCLALALIGIAKSSYVPTASAGDTAEYLRVLAAIKSGTVKLPNQNISGIPWVYTSQGLKFEEKLKQIHDSRTAALPKKPVISPPSLPAVKDEKSSWGILDWLGVITLILGVVGAVTCACCCWFKCATSTPLSPL